MLNVLSLLFTTISTAEASPSIVCHYRASHSNMQCLGVAENVLSVLQCNTQSVNVCSLNATVICLICGTRLFYLFSDLIPLANLYKKNVTLMTVSPSVNLQTLLEIECLLCCCTVH